MEKMKKYIIAIEETVVQEFEVAAKNREEALSSAEEKYRKGEFVLEPGELQYTQMKLINPENEKSEWIEI